MGSPLQVRHGQIRCHLNLYVSFYEPGILDKISCPCGGNDNFFVASHTCDLQLASSTNLPIEHQARVQRRRQDAVHAGKNAAPSTQNLFSKRPKFTSRPSFADSAAPQGSGKNASTNPAGRTKKPSAGKAGEHFSGKSAKPDRRDTTTRSQNHAPHAGKRGKKPGQARAKSSGSRTSKSGMSKSGASRSRPGGHGRLKRRASS